MRVTPCSEPAKAVSYTHLDVYKRQVDGAPIGDADALQAAIAAHRVGDRIEVTWLDAAGERHTCLLYTSRCV